MSTPNSWSDAPADCSAPGLIPVPMKSRVLLLTQAGFTVGIRRGKWWRCRVAMEQRTGEAAGAAAKVPPS